MTDREDAADAYFWKMLAEAPDPETAGWEPWRFWPEASVVRTDLFKRGRVSMKKKTTKKPSNVILFPKHTTGTKSKTPRRRKQVEISVIGELVLGDKKFVLGYDDTDHFYHLGMYCDDCDGNHPIPIGITMDARMHPPTAFLSAVMHSVYAICYGGDDEHDDGGRGA